MRLHDTPENDERPTGPDGPGGGSVTVPRPRLTIVLGALVVAGLLAVLVWAVLSADDTTGERSGAPDCPTTVRVTTTAEFAPVVEAATARLAPSTGECAGYAVTVASSATTAEQIGAGLDVPHVWIPDSDTWVSRAEEGDSAPNLDVGATLATTPVVLAATGTGAPSDDVVVTARPWEDVLDGSLELRLDEPRLSTASLLALLSAGDALGSTPDGEQRLLAATIELSRQPATADELFPLVGEREEPVVFPTTEQQVVSARADDPAAPLEVLVPAEALGALSYPWVVVDPGHDDTTREAVQNLGQSLTGVAGVTDREEAGFRTADGEGVIDLPGASTAVPTVDEALAVLADWDAARRDARVLTVVDVSPSMLEDAGGDTRLGQTAEGVRAALDILPEDTELGHWAFSAEHDSGEDWTELAPVAPLDGSAEDLGESLTAAASSVADGSADGTGLYDTVRAAYREMQEDSGPGSANAVVLVTDGRDDNTDGLTLYELLLELQTIADPERPVQVHVVGIGPDVYEHELQLIAELTGGRHALAADAGQVSTAVTDALTRPFRAE